MAKRLDALDRQAKREAVAINKLRGAYFKHPRYRKHYFKNKVSPAGNVTRWADFTCTLLKSNIAYQLFMGDQK